MALRVRNAGNLVDPSVGMLVPGKMRTRAASKKVQSTLGTRGALEDISNVDRANVQPGGKKEIVKPKRGMTRSKATSSLKSLVALGVQPVIKPVVQSPEPMDMSDVSDALEAFSNNLRKDVADIDKDDFGDPQLCCEIVNEVYHYMRHLENKFRVTKDYMCEQEITERMRIVLVDWLVQVQLRFRLLQETLFLTIQILDRYLETQSVSKHRLQLVGVTSMLLAAKYEEMYPPEIGDFVYITDNAYSKAQIRAMECDILRKLDFNLGKPLCIHFLRRNSKAGGVDDLKHTLAKYLMELTLPEYSFVKCNPSEIAAAASWLSSKILEPELEWTPTLVYYSMCNEDHLMPILTKIAAIITKAPTSKYQAVRLKYSSSKLLGISNIPELKSSPVVINLADKE